MYTIKMVLYGTCTDSVGMNAAMWMLCFVRFASGNYLSQHAIKGTIMSSLLSLSIMITLIGLGTIADPSPTTTLIVNVSLISSTSSSKIVTSRHPGVLPDETEP